MKKLISKYTIVVIYFFLLVVCNMYVVSIAFVVGDSMEPNYVNGDIMILYKLNKSISVGDVVITNRDNQYHSNILKRVVATEGQSVVISEGKLLVDGDEIYSYDGITASKELNIIVPDNSVYLIGDNFHYSKDSREIGAINLDDIIGEVIT